MYRQDRVLVTYGWCRNAWAIMRSLSKKGIEVYAGDSEKYCMCSKSKYKKGFFVYPDFRTHPEAFIDSVIEYIKENEIGVYIPVHEEIMTFAKYIDKFPSEVIVPISNYDKIFSLYNKYKLWEIAKRLSISLPRTINPKSEDELKQDIQKLTFPLIVKAQNSNGSKGVKIVENRDEAITTWTEFNNNTVLTPIVQEYVDGRMYAVSLLFNEGVEISRFVRRNIREKEYFGGTCTKAESIKKDDITNEAVKILKELDYTGVVMFEFLVNEEKDQNWLIEANPRYWGTTGLDIDSGVDFPYYQYLNATNKDVLIENGFYNEGFKSRWLIGDMISFLNNIRTPKNKRRLFREYLKFDDNTYMDLKKDDIGAFFGEGIYYFKKFLKYKSTNPIEDGVLS